MIPYPTKELKQATDSKLNNDLHMFDLEQFIGRKYGNNEDQISRC